MTKPKVDFENRDFQSRWEGEFLFVSIRRKPACLVWRANITVSNRWYYENVIVTDTLQLAWPPLWSDWQLSGNIVFCQIALWLLMSVIWNWVNLHSTSVYMKNSSCSFAVNRIRHAAAMWQNQHWRIAQPHEREHCSDWNPAGQKRRWLHGTIRRAH